MRSKTQRAGVGRHHKTTTSQTAKGRIALVTVAAGAASTAGVGGAAAAQMQANADHETKAQSVDYDLTTDSNELAENGAAAVETAAPQILAIAESKPVDNLSEQLNKAIEAADARIAADAASRAPSIVKPAEGAYTSGFGARWGAMHNGIDLANAIGTPIVAAMDGIVIDSGPASGFGNWIRIKHEDGSIAVYGHMETLDVAVGDQVHAGQKIAGMGSRGFSTGSHLHFEIHPDGNTPVDPIPWFAERGINIS